MGLYSKFIQDGDCRAYYMQEGKVIRLGADENNNVDHQLSESEVMIERVKKGINFSELKTEQEIMLLLDVHLPE